VNTALLALLLLVFGQRGAPYDATSLETVWRLSFFLGLVPVAGMLIWRLFRLEESRVWQEKRRKLKREVWCRGTCLCQLHMICLHHQQQSS